MAKAPRIFADVAELLEEYCIEIGQEISNSDDPESQEDLGGRYDRVQDILRRYKAEFGEEEFPLYLPRAGTFLRDTVVMGSAIVGAPASEPYEEKVQVCYEGNIYGASNLSTYRERAGIAADRLATGFLMSEWAVVDEQDLEPVGYVSRFAAGPHGSTRRRYEVRVLPGAREMLAAWIGVSDADLDEALSEVAG